VERVRDGWDQVRGGRSKSSRPLLWTPEPGKKKKKKKKEKSDGEELRRNSTKKHSPSSKGWGSVVGCYCSPIDRFSEKAALAHWASGTLFVEPGGSSGYSGMLGSENSRPRADLWRPSEVVCADTPSRKGGKTAGQREMRRQRFTGNKIGAWGERWE